MKYLSLLLNLIFILSFVFMFNNITLAEDTEDKAVAVEEEKLISAGAGCSYSSLYLWRGIVLFHGAPAFFPTAEVGIGDFTLTYLAGINEVLFTAEDSNTEKTADLETEMDYTIAYGIEFDMLSLEAGLTYFQYLFYDEPITVEGEVIKEEIDPSYWEASLSLTINTILSPSIILYYDYYVEEGIGEDEEKTPVDEDYYITFSITHDLISTEDGFSMTIGAWAGYYNYQYCEMKGWSDAAASLGFSKEYNGLTASSNFYYSRTLGKDFRQYNEGKKNHFWCDFGLTYSI